jgi:YHS domain-containing protein
LLVQASFTVVVVLRLVLPARWFITQIDILFFNVVYANTTMFKDPVCNMMVDEKKAQHISEVDGQKIYLCSASCKNQFDQNPSKYGY